MLLIGPLRHTPRQWSAPARSWPLDGRFAGTAGRAGWRQAFRDVRGEFVFGYRGLISDGFWQWRGNSTSLMLQQKRRLLPLER